MKHWKNPGKHNINKVYEALSAVVDDRIELIDNTHAKCHSSTGSKYYTLSWTADFSAMMSDDNAAFYNGDLSYPMIAVMLETDRISYDKEAAKLLGGIIWKDVNKKTRNNWDLSVFMVLKDLKEKGMDTSVIKTEAERIFALVQAMKVEYLGDKVPQPPEGY
jgi:uncharacterized protein (UPF0371 family)